MRIGAMVVMWAVHPTTLAGSSRPCLNNPRNYNYAAPSTSTRIESAGHLVSVVMTRSAPSTIAVATTRASGRRKANPCSARRPAAIAPMARDAGSMATGRASRKRSTVVTPSPPRRLGATRHSAYAETGITSMSPPSRATASAARVAAWCTSAASRTATMTPASSTVSPTRRVAGPARRACRHRSVRPRTGSRD